MGIGSASDQHFDDRSAAACAPEDAGWGVGGVGGGHLGESLEPAGPPLTATRRFHRGNVRRFALLGNRFTKWHRHCCDSIVVQEFAIGMLGFVYTP